MSNSIVDRLKSKEAAVAKVLQKVKDGSVYFVKRSIPVAVKIATSGVLNVGSDSTQAIAELSQQMAKEQIEKYEIAKSRFADFKKHLEAFVYQVASPENKPVVFFIDELDRCRPIFAIEILERAKHLFNVPGLVFVIAIDKDQIGHSIKSVYGQGMNVDGYLRRFIDIDYRLPQPDSTKYARYLFEKFELTSLFSIRNAGNAEEDQFLDTFNSLCRVFCLSLRVQEQCLAGLSIAVRTTPAKRLIHPMFLAVLLCLKAVQPKLYRDYIDGVIDGAEVLRHIRGLPYADELLNGARGSIVEAYIAVGNLSNNDMAAEMKKYADVAGNESSEKENRDRANLVLQRLKSFHDWDMDRVADYLSRKIDILERFIPDDGGNG